MIALALAAAVSASAATFESVYRAAVGSPAPAAARALAEGTRADADRTRAALLPELSVSAGAYRWSESITAPAPLSSPVRPDRREELELRVEQPVFAGGTLWKGYKAADATARSSSEAASSARERALYDAGTLAYSLLEAREAASTAQAELERRQGHLRDAEARSKAGMLAPPALDRVRSEAKAAEADAIEARRLATELEIRLARLTGLDVATLEAPAPLALAGEEAGSSAEVRAAEAAARSAEITANGATGRFLPTVSVGAAARRFSESPHTLLFFEDEKLAYLRARWAVFAGGERVAALRTARAAQRHAQAELQGARDRQAVETAVARENARAAEARIEAEQSRLDAAKAAHEQATRRFAAGTATAVELLDAATALHGAETGLRRARYARDRAVLDFHRAQGTLEKTLIFPTF